jgi:hypothetical protein
MTLKTLENSSILNTGFLSFSTGDGCGDIVGAFAKVNE